VEEVALEQMVITIMAILVEQAVMDRQQALADRPQPMQAAAVGVEDLAVAWPEELEVQVVEALVALVAARALPHQLI